MHADAGWRAGTEGSDEFERGWRIMTVLSDFLGRRLQLTRPQAAGVAVERDLRVPMDDGVILLADRYVPRGAGPMPTVLVRTPYGRRNVFGVIYGRLYAERGLQVLVQSVRGTFGSGGEFGPFDERADGLNTIAWIQDQPWHEGKIGMAGMSYLGQVQWAVAADAGDALGAIAPSVAASQFHGASLQRWAGARVSPLLARHDRPPGGAVFLDAHAQRPEEAPRGPQPPATRSAR